MLGSGHLKGCFILFVRVRKYVDECLSIAQSHVAYEVPEEPHAGLTVVALWTVVSQARLLEGVRR